MNNHKSTTQFDKELLAIDHYKKYGLMLPYIGENYGKVNLKVLFIGESHYLPEESKQSNDTWYSADENILNPTEKEYINTRGIVAGDWKPKAHVIYKELSKALNGLSTDTDCRGMDYASFMNGFQRPAPNGDSIKGSCSPLDREIATSTIKQVISIIKPNLVIFASKFTWDTLKQSFKSDKNITFKFVSHPCGAHFYIHNNKDKLYKIISERKKELDKTFG